MGLMTLPSVRMSFPIFYRPSYTQSLGIELSTIEKVIPTPFEIYARETKLVKKFFFTRFDS